MLLSKLPMKEGGVFSNFCFQFIKRNIQLRTPEDFNITGKQTGAKKSNVTNLV